MRPICGLKYTHDAAVAVIDKGKLKFSVEVEKVNNNPRYSRMERLHQIDDILMMEGYTSEECAMVVDGWVGSKVTIGGQTIPVAANNEAEAGAHPLYALAFDGYVSYQHISGHIVGSYVTSPFADNYERTYVLCWDGSQNPIVHVVDPKQNNLWRVASLFPMCGTIYGSMAYYFGPYKNHDVISGFGGVDKRKGDGYDKPGKLMSYIALGNVSFDLLRFLRSSFEEQEKVTASHNEYWITARNVAIEHRLLIAAQYYCWANRIRDEDALATIHHWLETMLVKKIIEVIPEGSNVVFTGGCALNIKWNTAIREAGYNIWVPPFPNDSGSAIGMAACEYVKQTRNWKVDWNVYCGPHLVHDYVSKEDWRREQSSIHQLAKVLAERPDKPVVVLNGRSEIGPRALGHRSIMMDVRGAANKDTLNRIKKRESFRPVSPICLEESAPHYFSPGCRDPYMLFDHKCERPAEIPAVVHLDGTSRLQTVGKDGSLFVRDLLLSYHKLTGVPMLCNTSANKNGSGFFQSVKSAIDWADENGVDTVWANNWIYRKGVNPNE